MYSFSHNDQEQYLPRRSYLNDFEDRYYRIREQEYGYSPCRFCLNHHRSDSEKCYFICKYCHSIHFKKDLKKTDATPNQQLCPMMALQASHQQQKRSFPCDQCSAAGFVEKITKVTYCEPNTRFQIRVKEYEKLKEQLGDESLQIPVRKTYRTSESSRLEECFQCRGKGRIFRVTDCCDRGCNECNFSKIKINPVWRELRLKGEDNDEVFPCRICSQQVLISEKILKLSCGHTFHQKCSLQWLMANELKCYLCLEVDPYLESDDLMYKESILKGNSFPQLMMPKEQTASQFIKKCLDRVNQIQNSGHSSPPSEASGLTDKQVEIRLRQLEESMNLINVQDLTSSIPLSGGTQEEESLVTNALSYTQIMKSLEQQGEESDWQTISDDEQELSDAVQ